MSTSALLPVAVAAGTPIRLTGIQRIALLVLAMVEA